MADKTNAELIAAARRRPGEARLGRSIRRETDRDMALLLSLADALEAAEQRAVEAERERDDLESRLADYLCDSTGGLLSKTGYDVRTMVAHTEDYYAKLHAEERADVESERDALVAVVEKAEDHLTRHYLDMRVADEVLPILAAAPADVLRERDARVWDEGDAARRMYVENRRAGRNVTMPRNPYRQKREEQD